VLLHNTRNSRERYGDLRSQYAGCVAAERRGPSFFGKDGGGDFQGGMGEKVKASERLSRGAGEENTDGNSSFEDDCDDDAVGEEPIKIATKIRVKGKNIYVDFAASSPQVRGGMNAPWAVTVSATCYAIKCLTDPENPPNSGSYRPIKIDAPAG